MGGLCKQCVLPGTTIARDDGSCDYDYGSQIEKRELLAWEAGGRTGTSKRPPLPDMAGMGRQWALEAIRAFVAGYTWPLPIPTEQAWEASGRNGTITGVVVSSASATGIGEITYRHRLWVPE